LNGGLDVVVLLVAVVLLPELGAGDGDQGQVVGPHALEVGPGALRGPAGARGAVAQVELVGVAEAGGGGGG